MKNGGLSREKYLEWKRKKSRPEKTIREWLLQNGTLYGDYTNLIQACVAALGVKRPTVYQVASILRREGVKILPKEKKDQKPGGMGLSEQELRSKHDALFKLEQAIKLLTPGKFIPEPEFRSLVGLDPAKFRSKSDLPQFESYKGRVQGVTYWGSPKEIKKLKDEGVLS